MIFGSAVVILSLFLGTVAQRRLLQEKISLTRTEGKTVGISCKAANLQSGDYIHWYMKKDGEPLKRIGYLKQDGSGTVYDSSDPENKFEIKKDGGDFILKIQATQPFHNAVYYCACWDSGTKTFGSGTKLIVSDSKPKSPTVTIYHSSKPSENAFLCVASDMFPEIARVTWEKKGSPGESVNIENQRTTTIQEETNTISSLIMMESKQNEEVSKYFCRVEHDTGTKEQSALTKVGNGKPAPVTGGPEKCVRRSVTHTNVTGTDHFKNQRELLTISMSYSVLILKSVAYFGIVSVLIYKKA